MKLPINQKGFTPLFIIIGVLIILGVAGGAYYSETTKNNKLEQTSPKITTSSANVAASHSPSVSPTVKPLPILDKPIKEQTSLPTTPSPTSQPVSPKPTPTPILQPISTPEPSYNDLHCPKVIMIEDSLGNTSTGTNLSGTFKKGSIDLLTVKITSTDPQNLPLYYQYSYSRITGHNPYLGNWSTNNTYNVDVTNAYVGSNRVLFASIDNQDGYGCSGAYYDTSIQFSYDITP